MADPIDLEVRIAADGRVEVHVKGAKGAACTHYTDLLAQILGPKVQEQLTQEAYESQQVQSQRKLRLEL